MKHIIVVGAGTAGWITASAIKKNCPEVNVTIVYDSNTPTVGVGETLSWNMPSSLFRDLLGLEDDQWFDQTDAIYKTAILFENWRGNNDSELVPHFYEFDAEHLLDPASLVRVKRRIHVPSVGGPNVSDVWYTMYRKGLLDKEFKNFPEHGGDGYYFALNNKSIRDLNGNWLVGKWAGYSYQYDAELVGTTIGNLLGRPLGVNVIDSKVREVLVDDTGITGIRIADGSVLSADLFVDCSGFKRLLASELDNTWVDFDEYYNNTALVAPIPYDDSGHPLHSLRPLTVLAGMDSGWRFSVASRTRTGNGYIFNSRQEADVDKISNEFRQCLGVDSSKQFRTLKWTPGYFKNTWHKNCITMGLSIGFGDPYDANSLALSISVLRRLISTLQNKLVETKEQFNQRFEDMWKEIDLRIQTTLRLSPRRDTAHYKLMAQVAEETNLKQRWFEHIENRRVNYFSTRDRYIFPIRSHIALAMRYNIELPTLDVDSKYYDAVNKYFNDMQEKGETLSSIAPTSKEYYSNRKR